MKQVCIMSSVGQIKKMPVALLETGETMGRILDVILHPIEGTVLGLIVQSTEGVTYALAADDFFILNKKNIVVVAESAMANQSGAWGKMTYGISVSRKAIGASIVTENGRYVGYVSDVFIADEPLRVVYQVLESLWQKYFGSGFYIPADLPYAWSRDGLRFIVRDEELTRRRVSQPAEAIRSDNPKPIIKKESHQVGK
jgi:sporulation protein YlmC with PRC-barrel domain